MTRRAEAALTATNTAGYGAPVGITVNPAVFTIIEDHLHLLMVHRQDPPDLEMLALPGGFVGPSETPLATAARKLEEKTGVHPRYLEQLGTYADPGRDPRGWIPTIAYLALIPYEEIRETSHDAAWVSVLSLAPEAVALDHFEIVEDALARIRGKIWYSNIALGLLPAEFTIGKMRRVYELILDRNLDPGNFARDIKRSGLIVHTGNTERSGRGRPGKTYRFVSQELQWIPGRRGTNQWSAV